MLNDLSDQLVLQEQLHRVTTFGQQYFEDHALRSIIAKTKALKLSSESAATFLELMQESGKKDEVLEFDDRSQEREVMVEFGRFEVPFRDDDVESEVSFWDDGVESYYSESNYCVRDLSYCDKDCGYCGHCGENIYD